MPERGPLHFVQGDRGAQLDRVRRGLFLRGTFAPFFRASDSPIAIACLRLLTLPPRPPFPRRSVPLFRWRIALSTPLLAPLPYRRLLDLREVLFFLAAMSSPGWGSVAI